jgi:hypothetical protein
MKLNLDPKMFYGVVAVVVVGAAFLVFRGANSSPKVPLPDASHFNGPAHASNASPTK